MSPTPFARRWILILSVLLATLLLTGCGDDTASGSGNPTDVAQDTIIPDDTQTDTIPAPSCDDGELNGSESDVDCGGECGACDDGNTCSEGPDCSSGVCGDGFCDIATCFDLFQNQNETDTDCGGDCEPCTSGFACEQHGDCTTGECLPDSTCAGARCDDGIQNGEETSTDCGGPCGPCTPGNACLNPEDCDSSVCLADLCQEPACDDDVQNAAELGVDCGGGVCDGCPPLSACNTNTDCDSQICVEDVKLCIADHCTDEIRNAGETGVDCGGDECLTCGSLATCQEDSDCTSGVCVPDVAGNLGASLCVGEHCNNTTLDADESDIDCGGSACLPCDDGAACALGSDCQSLICGTDGLCAAVECGDGVLSGGEECDDAGESVTCNSDCTPNLCGDSITNTTAGEACDDGASNSDTNPDACRTDCSTPTCGDTVLDAGEICDDGNIGSGDGCAADCSSVEPGFSCDDSLPALCDTTCGDGITAGEEACDDGDATDGDGCSADCTTIEPGFSCTGTPSVCQAGCGDDLVTGSEECDAATLPTAGCDLDCTFAVCGDGTLNTLAGEVCDDGAANSDAVPDVCRTDCNPSACGDGIRDTGETCDDGNTQDSDGCAADCSAVEVGFTCTGFAPDTCFSACGDGILASDEVCDDSNSVANDGCAADCSAIEDGWDCTGEPSVCNGLCGDGIVAGTEACDDGTLVNNDGCDTSCQIESGWACSGAPSVCDAAFCGDSIIAGDETCDDNNSIPEDGCSDSCTVESGWVCSGSPSICGGEACGDGIVAGAESCDDDNNTNNDGCSATCILESGWVCTGEPSVCTGEACGDGIIAGVESCDDDNNTNNDGCSATCILESGWDCTGEPSVCTGLCGDGIVAGTETCDDGILVNNDGCNTLCQVEAGWDCTGEPSICGGICGDGIIAGAETCDDGVLVNNDGCNTLCQVEAGWDCTGEPSVCAAEESCQAILNAGVSTGDGMYLIDPDGGGPITPFMVYCDMTTDGGGWTAIDPDAANNGFSSVISGDTTCIVSSDIPQGHKPGRIHCQYDISTGFAFNHLRLEGVELSIVSGLVENTQYTGPWGSTTCGTSPSGDFVMGTPAHGERVLSYGEYIGRTSCGVYTTHTNGSVLDWFGVDANSSRDTTLRMEFGENGGEDEGWGWNSGQVFVRNDNEITGGLATGDPGMWEDGSVAASCDDYRNPTGPYAYFRSDGGVFGDGIYLVDFDGAGPGIPEEVDCNMTSDGGGWMKVMGYNAADDGSAFANHAAKWNSTDAGMETDSSTCCSKYGCATDSVLYASSNGSDGLYSVLYYTYDLSAYGVTEARFVHDDRTISWDGALLTKVRFEDDSLSSRQIYNDHSCAFEAGACTGGEIPNEDPSGTELINTSTINPTDAVIKDFMWGIKQYQAGCGDAHRIYSYDLWVR